MAAQERATLSRFVRPRAMGRTGWAVVLKAFWDLEESPLEVAVPAHNAQWETQSRSGLEAGAAELRAGT
jgi:hypothetical protein